MSKSDGVANCEGKKIQVPSELATLIQKSNNTAITTLFYYHYTCEPKLNNPKTLSNVFRCKVVDFSYFFGEIYNMSLHIHVYFFILVRQYIQREENASNM